MEPGWILFSVAGLLALGWSFFNGCHRRDRAYKATLADSVERFPPFTRRKLLRLLAPTRFKDRVNHATVIAGCCAIIGTPLAIAFMLLGLTVWWHAPLILVGGTLAGAYFGELVLNSWGCALVLPAEATDPQSARADAREGSVQNP